MKVEVCDNPITWNGYIASAPEASNYHRWGWREVIEQTYGHKPYYLIATVNGETKGVLPLVQMKSRLFGNFLVSIPFFSYGGLVTSSHEAQEALLEGAAALANNLGVSHIELRHDRPQQIDWHDTTPKVTMQVELPETTDLLWKSLSTGLRNKIRNAQKNSLRVEWNGEQATNTFYQIFSASMRNLGTPVYPEKWFSNLYKRFPSEVKVLTIFDGSSAVASGIVTCFRDGIELPWSASEPESRKKYSTVFLYWKLLEWAITNGYKRVDFGRCTKGSGVYEFKRHWNSQERPLHWHYWLAPGVPIPELRPDNPRYQLATQIWKRLPLRVANLLGPWIVRSLP